MANFKDFDVLIAEEAAGADDAPRFQLKGVEFRGVIKPSAASMLKLVVAEGNLVASIEYIATMIRAEQRQQFRDLINDDGENAISMDILNQISQFLMEEYTGRPTEA